MFLASKIFLGKAPEILDRHYKIGSSPDYRAKFHAGRPTHLEDLALKIHHGQNLSHPENYRFRAE